MRLTGTDALAARASKKLRSDELLVTTLGSTILRKCLDDIPLWRGDHVEVRQLVDDFGRYLYLPRVAVPEIVVTAMKDGVALLTWQTDTFAFAESYDGGAQRYRGVRGGVQVATLEVDSPGLLVKSDVAWRQLNAEVTPGPGASGPTQLAGAAPADSGRFKGPTPADTRQTVVSLPRRFHGTVQLDPTRVGRDASRIADEVIAHLVGQIGAEVSVTLEISANLPKGATEQLQRTVTENSRTLKFGNHGFESD
jgi:hypothetical protein